MPQIVILATHDVDTARAAFTQFLDHETAQKTGTARYNHRLICPEIFGHEVSLPDYALIDAPIIFYYTLLGKSPKPLRTVRVHDATIDGSILGLFRLRENLEVMMSDALPSVPMMKPNADSPVERLNTFLDQHVLPY